MDYFLQIIMSIAPALVVFMTTALFLKKQNEREIIKLNLELKKERQDHFLPNRLEAYQRLVLFLERIHPNSLIMRLHNPGLPARTFQTELIAAIREEFDHNVAQQLFVTPQAWAMAKSAKEETLKIVNIAGNQMNELSLSTDLATKTFELVAEIGKLPSEIAVDFIKKEFQEML
jgi:hypothetical protein